MMQVAKFHTIFRPDNADLPLGFHRLNRRLMPRHSSGSLAILAAMRRASSRVARLAAVRLPVSVLLDYPGQSHFQHPKLVEILATIFTCPVGGDRTPVRSCVEMSY